jgi:hypothetical protein
MGASTVSGDSKSSLVALTISIELFDNGSCNGIDTKDDDAADTLKGEHAKYPKTEIETTDRRIIFL